MKWYPSAVLSDVLDKIGYTNCVFPSEIQTSYHGINMCGRARTIGIVPCQDKEEAGDIYHALHFLEQLEAGDILLVAEHPSIREYAFFGGLMAALSKQIGLAGAIIDGKTRDWKDTIADIFPVFSRGYCPQDMNHRGIVADVDCKVTIGSIGSRHIGVESGDYLFGDCDGVVVVPFGISTEVFAGAEKVLNNEQVVKELIENDVTVEEVIKQCGDF